MVQYIKDPDATLDYKINWESWLDDDSISSSTWIVDTGLVVEDQDNDTTSATIWLSGGTSGNKYTVTNRIETSAGRIDDRSIIIYVNNK